MVSPESGNIREGIIVHIERWEVLISKVLGEEVYQPSPTWVLLESTDVALAELLHRLSSNCAVGVLTHSHAQACAIGRSSLIYWVLFGNDRVYDDGSCIGNEGFTGRLQGSIE